MLVESSSVVSVGAEGCVRCSLDEVAVVSNAILSILGIVLPLREARASMPRAPLADTKNSSEMLCGGSRISATEGSEDEHTPSALRHSEVAAIESPPGHAIPEVGQRSKNNPEVGTASISPTLEISSRAAEETRNVLNEKPVGSKSPGDSGELEEEGGVRSLEARPPPGDGEVGAWKSSAEKIDMAGSGADVSDVSVDGDPGEVVGEHPSPVLVELAEEPVSESGSCESEVEPSDSTECSSDIHVTSQHSNAPM